MYLYKNYWHEIKNRCLCILYSLLITAIISYKYKTTLLYIYIKPSINYFTNKTLYFIYTNISELFYTYINLIISTTIQTTFLFVLIQILLFFKPGLYKKEFILLKNLTYTVTIVWLISILVIYKILLPFSWEFFFNIQNNQDQNQIEFFFEAKLNEYLLFIESIFYMCTMCIFIISTFFIYLYTIPNTLNYLKQYRKKIYFSIYIVASIITPPDIFSQIILGTISILIFELYIYLLIINKTSKVTN